MSEILSGIYCIKHTGSGKMYVGSANVIRSRWNAHKSDLRRDRHDNEYLQRAWNKYGESAFEFYVIEYVNDRCKILNREQYWIDFYQTYKRSCGYNISRIAGTTIGYRHTNQAKQLQSQRASKTHEGFINPSGGQVVITNLRKFCQEAQLDERSMLRLRKGEISHHHGWTYAHSTYVDKRKLNKTVGDRNSRTYVNIVDPQGHIYPIVHNLDKFCKEHSLDSSALLRTSQGKQKQHKGWIMWEQPQIFI